MFKDDDEEEENTFGVTRYPCMPSLVALQQMRNRLHLAFLGRKLMKWTALATGREMRRLAQELYEVYDGFADDLRNAFILLARSRYFYPALNGVVIEDVPKKAGVVVQQCGRTVSGVKIVQFEIAETEYPPYPHLGLEKGGQTILETKKAWLELLKRLIMMMQLRAGFLMVEIANRNANKKMNVLKRIVIPRTNLSVGYILTELEEIAREEFCRLKKVKEKKKRDYELRHKKDEPKKQDEPVKTSSSGKIPEGEKDKSETQITKQLSENIEPIANNALTPESEDKPDLIPSLTNSYRAEKELPPIVTIQAPESSEPFVELFATPSKKSSIIIDEGINETMRDNRLEYLKRHLNELIALGKEFVQSGLDRIDINNFLKRCEEAKLKLEPFFKVEDYPMVDKKLEQKLEHLKILLREVIEITKEFQHDATLTSSVENFIKMCEDVHERLHIYKQGIATPSVTVDNDKVRLEEFRNILTDVENITKEYNKRGLLSPSAEAFIKACSEMKLKVNEYMCCQPKGKIISTQPSIETQRQPSIEKQKSEMQPTEKQTSSVHSEILHLIKHIDETIGLGVEAGEEGLISDSVVDNIKSFDKMKSQITSRNEKHDKLQNLQLNIEEIMNLTARLKTDGIVTASVEGFLKLCEDTIYKLHGTQKRSLSTLKNDSKANTVSYIDSCMNNAEVNLTNEEKNSIHEETPLLFDVSPCCSCNPVVQEKELKASLSKESLLNENVSDNTYAKCAEDEDTLRSQMRTVLNSSDQSQEILCETCKRDMLQSNVSADKQSPSEKETEPNTSEVDSKLGYFEKKVQRKVTRILNSDGTIWEKKETITMRKEKHVSTETSFAEDEVDISDDTSEENSYEEVNICIVPNFTQRGFIRNVRPSRSDSFCNHTSFIEPCLRFCLSLDNVCLTMREQI